MVLVLVCGGRAYSNRSFLFDYMDARDSELHITHLMNGGAPGADRLSDQWAESRGIQPVVCRALWDFYKAQGRHGAAGPIRNRRMGEFRPHKVYAFPGGTGTTDMVVVARRLGLDVTEVVEP